MALPDYSFEIPLWNQGFLVAGVDEVGRGALAGPIVSGAVIFSPDTKIRNSKFEIRNDKEEIIINESKKLTANQRERAAEWIRKHCLAYGIGEVGVHHINKQGIQKANRLALRRALRVAQGKLESRKLFILIDGYRIKYLAKNQKGIVHGDGKSFSIAAASIIAKVYRDRLMKKMHRSFKQYRWDQNKGYGTKAHAEAIRKYGITVFHRTLFVRKIV